MYFKLDSTQLDNTLSKVGYRAEKLVCSFQTDYYWMSLLCFLKYRNSVQAPISCDQLLCTFPAVPQLEEYNISLVVKDQLGEETACYSFNISDRGQSSHIIVAIALCL